MRGMRAQGSAEYGAAMAAATAAVLAAVAGWVGGCVAAVWRTLVDLADQPTPAALRLFGGSRPLGRQNPDRMTIGWPPRSWYGPEPGSAASTSR